MAVSVIDQKATESAITAHHVIRRAVREGLAEKKLRAIVDVSPTDPPLFEDRVDTAKMHALWEFVMRALRDPSFPVRAAVLSREEMYSDFSAWLVSQQTLAHAFARVGEFSSSWSNVYRWRVEVSAREACVTLECPPPHALGERCHIEFHLADAVNLIRTGVGDTLRITRATFTHERPRDTRAHAAAISSDVRFGERDISFSAPRETLDLPMSLHVPSASRALTARLEETVARHAETKSTAATVRALITRELKDSDAFDLDHAAARLHLGRRTLHRRLIEEGTSFRVLKDEVRREAALHALARNDAPKEIATALGFSDARAFYRAFKRWTGTTPKAAKTSSE